MNSQSHMNSSTLPKVIPSSAARAFEGFRTYRVMHFGWSRSQGNKVKIICDNQRNSMMFDEQTSDVTKQNYGFRKQEVSSN